MFSYTHVARKSVKVDGKKQLDKDGKVVWQTFTLPDVSIPLTATDVPEWVVSNAKLNEEVKMTLNEFVPEHKREIKVPRWVGYLIRGYGLDLNGDLRPTEQYPTFKVISRGIKLGLVPKDAAGNDMDVISLFGDRSNHKGLVEALLAQFGDQFTDLLGVADVK